MNYQELVKKANLLMRQKDWQQAMLGYLSIIDAYPDLRDLFTANINLVEKALWKSAADDRQASDKEVDPVEIDERLYYPRPINTGLRAEIGAKDKKKLIFVDLSLPSSNAIDIIGFLNLAITKQNIYHIIITIDPLWGLHSQYAQEANVTIIGDSSELDYIMHVASSDIVLLPHVQTLEAAFLSRIAGYFAIGRPIVLSQNIDLGPICHLKHAWILNERSQVEIEEAINVILQSVSLTKRLSVESVVYYRNFLSPSP